MRTEQLTLTDAEFAQLQQSAPDDGSGDSTGKRATALAHIYLARLHPGAETVQIPSGADIALRHHNEVFSYEIKGTRDSHIAPDKLKVSSLDSYNLLVAGAPLLRITAVFQRTPVVHTMLYGADFTLRPEPRWSLHLTNGRNA